MKHTFTLFLLGFALLLAACNNAPKPNEPVENKQQSVDWDMPLYELNAEGDTCSVWRYENTEQGRTVTKNDLPGDYGEGSTTEIYDPNDRLVSVASSLNTGNFHNTSMTYSYNGKVRTGEGSETTEGYSYFYAIKEVTYYLDDECKYDTLTQQYVAEMEWDWLYDEEGNEVDNVEKEGPLTMFTRNRYETTKDGGYQLVESQTYASSTVDPEEVNVEYSYKIVYAYNDKGQLVSEKLYDRNGNLGYETSYSYQDNKRIEQSGDEQLTTYYKIKDKR